MGQCNDAVHVGVGRQSLGGDASRETEEPAPIPSENRRVPAEEPNESEGRIGPVDLDDADQSDDE